MNYSLKQASIKDTNKLIDYKLNTILEYASDMSDDDLEKINNYVINEVNNKIDLYKTIIKDNKIIGSLLLEQYNDGVLLNEIYLEEEYRHNGIGKDILNNILKENEIIYLWVYKENKEALKLYQSLNFKIIEETETRYFMKYNSSNN